MLSSLNVRGVRFAPVSNPSVRKKNPMIMPVNQISPEIVDGPSNLGVLRRFPKYDAQSHDAELRELVLQREQLLVQIVEHPSRTKKRKERGLQLRIMSMDTRPGALNRPLEERPQLPIQSTVTLFLSSFATREWRIVHMSHSCYYETGFELGYPVCREMPLLVWYYGKMPLHIVDHYYAVPTPVQSELLMQSVRSFNVPMSSIRALKADKRGVKTPPGVSYLPDSWLVESVPVPKREKRTTMTDLVGITVANRTGEFGVLWVGADPPRCADPLLDGNNLLTKVLNSVGGMLGFEPVVYV